MTTNRAKVKWASTPWGNPHDPASLTRKERHKRRTREKEDYQIGRTAIAMGSATLNEKAILQVGIKAMFDRSNHPNGIDSVGLEKGVEAMERICSGLPIDVEALADKLADLWGRSEEARSNGKDRRESRVLMDAKRRTFTLKYRYYRHIADLFRYDRPRSHFRTSLRGVSSYIDPVIVNRGDAREFQYTPGSVTKSGEIYLSSAYASIRREINVHRFGDGTLIVGWADESKYGPGAMYVLRQGAGSSIRLVIATETRNRLGKEPRMRVLRYVSK